MFLSDSLFAETRDIAASPLKASQAYKNIVDGLQIAKVIALEAKEIAGKVYEKVRKEIYACKILISLDLKKNRCLKKLFFCFPFL